MRKKAVILFFLFAFPGLFFLPGTSMAGQIWIASGKFKVRTGDQVTLSLGQGVIFSRSYGLIFKKDLEFIHHRPDGGKTPLPLKPDKMVYKARVSLEKPGTHIFSAAQEGVKLVRSGRGWKLAKDKNKKTIGGSFTFNKFTKTFIRAGRGGSNFKKIVGGDLEIVPLKDPGGLHVGDRLKLKVLFRGKSAEMMPVKATYLGYGDKEDQVPVNNLTDIMGQTGIELTEAGPWFVYTYKVIQGEKVSRRRDKEVFESSLVFYVER